MSEETKNYLASDLAAELGVPRTTLNDWLKSYAAYLETEPRGKRRAYTAKSLSVLREVAELREAGKNGVEIDAELARRHGIRPEIAPDSVVDDTEEDEEATAAAPQSDSTALSAMPQPGNGLVRMSDDDIGKLFGMLEAQQQDREKNMRRFWRLFLFVVLLLLLALGIPLVVLSAQLLTGMKQERGRSAQRYEALDQRLTGTGDALEKLRTEQAEKLDRATTEAARAAAESAKLRAERQAELDKIAVTLDRNRKDYQDAITKLKSELETQRKSREAELQQMLSTKDKAHEADVVRMREEFARKQLEHLKKLEDAARQSSELEAELKKRSGDAPEALKKAQQELEERFRTLQKQLEEEKAKRASAEQSAETARKQTLELMEKQMPTGNAATK